MSGHAIQSIVAGIVIFVVSLVLFSPMATGADKLYREFITHCAVGDDTTLKVKVATVAPATDPLYTVGSIHSVIPGSTNGAACTLPTGTTVTALTLTSEDGQSVPAMLLGRRG